MKRALSIFLSILVFFCVINNGFILLIFKINQHSIITHFCTNKNQPELACEGKCFLKKKLWDNQSQESPLNPLTNIDKKVKINLLQTNPRIVREIHQLYSNQSVFPNNYFVHQYFSKRIFRPPVFTG